MHRQEIWASLDVRESQAYCLETNFSQLESEVIPPMQPEADGMVTDVGSRAQVTTYKGSKRDASIVGIVAAVVQRGQHIPQFRQSINEEVFKVSIDI